MRRGVIGAIVGVAASVGLAAVMLPFRPHLSVATAALVLVVPVVVGVIIGGFAAGAVSVAAGFLVYDLAFLQPYWRLRVAGPQDWVVLAVYAVVMLAVARVVADLDAARSQAQQRAVETRRLFELSELLVEDTSVEELLKTTARAVSSVFDLPGVTVLVPDADRLVVAASSGQKLTPDELHHLDPRSGMPVSLGTAPGDPDDPDEVRAVALTAAGRPVGILATRGVPASEADRALLRTFANHAALALERAQLREQALRSELLDEVDRLRHALVGSVSHDLRTPLASMKVASSILSDPELSLSEADRHELQVLIGTEIDRLTRLVTSLLDMTRFEAGAMEVQRRPTGVLDLVRESVAGLESALEDRSVELAIPSSLPDVDVDAVLIGQVLANLIENADRHAPPASPITLSGELCGDRVAISVMDRGPGVPPDERHAVFDRFVRFDTGGRAGLGLAIAKTFVEAHGERLWVEDAPGGGASFVFTLPVPASGHSGR